MLQGTEPERRVPGVSGPISPVIQEPKTKTKLKKEKRETREAPTPPTTVLASPGPVQGGGKGHGVPDKSKGDNGSFKCLGGYTPAQFDERTRILSKLAAERTQQEKKKVVCKFHV